MGLVELVVGVGDGLDDMVFVDFEFVVLVVFGVLDEDELGVVVAVDDGLDVLGDGKAEWVL